MLFHLNIAAYNQIIQLIHHAKLLQHVLQNLEHEYGLKDPVLSVNLRDIITQLIRISRIIKKK